MRECPLMIRLEDATAVEGIGLVFAENTNDSAVWTVVDFKTDIEVARGWMSIARRFSLRACGERSTGRPASGAILWI